MIEIYILIVVIIGHVANISPVRIELMVAQEAQPLATASSSDHWKRCLNGTGDVALVEEEGCQ